MYLSRKEQRPTQTTSAEGKIIQESLGSQVGKISSHSLAEVTIPPGESSSAHFHQQGKSFEAKGNDS